MAFSTPDSWSVTSGRSARSSRSTSPLTTFHRAQIDTRPRHAKLPSVETDTGDVVSLPELIEFNAKHNRDHLFCLQTLPGSNEEHSNNQNFLRLTHGEFHRLVHACQQWLCLNVGNLQLPSKTTASKYAKGSPVAILMESDVGLLIYLCAFLGLGVPTVLLSARLSPMAIENLTRKTRASWIVTTPRLEQKAKEAANLSDDKSTKPALVERVPFEHFMHNGMQKEDAVSEDKFSICKEGHYIDEQDRNVLILHSSGTTGLPKPIHTAHRYLLGYAACHDLSSSQVASGVNLSTLPLYHGFGLLAPGLSMSVGLPVCFPSSNIIPSASSTIKILGLSKATSIMTVPSVLEEIAALPEETVIASLKPLRFVIWGGGPLKNVVREKLAAMGISLVNHSGATEVGALGTVFIPNKSYDSKYIRFRQDIGVRFATSEVDGQEQFTMTAYPFGWDDTFVLQDKLLVNPEHPESDFQILGRNDDLIVLGTGEKVLPQILESALTALPEVRAALAFGEGQFEVGVIIETADQINDAEAFKATVWPTIVDAAAKMDAHARLSSPSLVLVVAPGTLPRSDKGSVMRKEAYRVLDAQIGAIYDSLDNSMISGTVVDADSLTFAQDLLKFIVKSLSWAASTDELTPDTDFFEYGMDSLQALRLRRLLMPTLLQKSAEPSKSTNIANDFVYQHSSVAAIVKYVKAQSQSTISKQERINGLVQEQIETLSDMKYGSCVLLTGSTGSLGSHLVHYLCESKHVTKVICLVRKLRKDAKTPSTPYERQVTAIDEKGLSISPGDLEKLEVLETNTAEQYLGLAVHKYRSLCQDVTHVLHNAWPVDFKRQVESFRAQFDTLRELIHLSRQAYLRSSPRRPILQFVSSIATIGRYGQKHNCTIVPEIPVSDISCGNPIGYAEAKAACEMMLECAAATYVHEIDVRYVRVGQMSGSRTSGYWKSSEHFPALVKSSIRVGALPQIPGTFSWLPVDDAANAMSEILFAESSKNCVYHLENPIRQSWSDAVSCLGTEMGLSKLIPLEEWVKEVGRLSERDNPAKQLLQFFEHEFKHNASGEVVMDTTHTRSVSPTLAKIGALESQTLRSYVRAWKKDGFLPQ